MTGTDVPGFLPSRNGLHFPNAWPAGTPALVVRTPVGRIGLGNAALGLCGGLVLAAADLAVAGLPPPDRVTPPPAGSAAVNYLTRRLLGSWNLPSGALRYLRWMSLPDADSGSRRGVWSRTAAELPRISRTLDEGRVCPLGVVTVASRRPTELGRNHQVLAYGYGHGYTRGGGEPTAELVLRVYDPNQPDTDHVEIRIDPGGKRAPGSDLTLPNPVRGVFPIDWSPHDPRALFDDEPESVLFLRR